MCQERSESPAGPAVGTPPPGGRPQPARTASLGKHQQLAAGTSLAHRAPPVTNLPDGDLPPHGRPLSTICPPRSTASSPCPRGATTALLHRPPLCIHHVTFPFSCPHIARGQTHPDLPGSSGHHMCSPAGEARGAAGQAARGGSPGPHPLTCFFTLISAVDLRAVLEVDPLWGLK